MRFSLNHAHETCSVGMKGDDLTFTAFPRFVAGQHSSVICGISVDSQLEDFDHIWTIMREKEVIPGFSNYFTKSDVAEFNAISEKQALLKEGNVQAVLKP